MQLPSVHVPPLVVDSEADAVPVVDEPPNKDLRNEIAASPKPMLEPALLTGTVAVMVVVGEIDCVGVCAFVSVPLFSIAMFCDRISPFRPAAARPFVSLPYGAKMLM